MEQKPLNSFLISLITTVIIVGALALLVWFVIIPPIRNFSFGGAGNREIIRIHEYFDLDPEITGLVFDGVFQQGGVAPFVEYSRTADPVIYLPASFLQAYIDPFLFWDNSAGVFFASTRYEMLEFVPDSLTFAVNGALRNLDAPLRRINNEIFLPASVVEGLYALVVEYRPEYNMIIVSQALVPYAVGIVSVNTANVRFSPESRAPIMTQLSQGDEVVVRPAVPQAVSMCSIAVGTAEHIPLSPTSAFVRVRTPQGLLGYMLQEDLNQTYLAHMHDISARQTILPHFIDNMAHQPPNWDGTPINLVWEVIYHRDANALRMQDPLHRSVNVVSPTWFRFDGENLRINSVASRAYVDWAHSQGVDVWPLVFDISQPIARAILMNRDARRTVISQLVEYVQFYNLDGINIDIEHLFAAEEGAYKIQFLREIAIPMREMGVVLSADVKVPMDWSRFYRRYLIGLTVDFVVVMTYDEHWATSPTSGPVASLGWVNRGIINMLQEVPREQLIMGLPFYNRIWREEPLGGGGVTSRAWGMNATRDWFDERGVEWEWDATVGSYYGRVTVMEDGRAIVHRVWLECERSITAKMQIYTTHNLAGVAGWRRGLESEATWTVLEHFFR